MRTIAVTTRVRITATKAAPASEDVDPESFATAVCRDDATAPLESPTCAEVVPVAVQETSQQLVKTNEKL